MVGAACEPCTRRAARAGRDVIMRSGLMLKGTNTALMLAVLARSILPRGWRGQPVGALLLRTRSQVPTGTLGCGPR